MLNLARELIIEQQGGSGLARRTQVVAKRKQTVSTGVWGRSELAEKTGAGERG